MIFIEKIEPLPPIPLTEEDQAKLIAEAIVSENRRFHDFLDRLAGLARDVKR